MRLMQPIDVTTLAASGTSAPTQGQGQAFPSGLTTGCGTLYFLNKSNFGLYLLFEDGTVVSLPAWFARPFKLTKKSNQLWITQSYMLNIASPPIQQLWYEAYQQSEDATGLYAGPIPYQSTVGGSVSSTLTQIINSGEGTPNDVILDTPAGYGSPSIHLINTGELHLAPKGNAAQQDALAVIPGAGLGTYATVQLDADTLATDGQGDLIFQKAQGGVTQSLIQFLLSGGAINWAVQLDALGQLHFRDTTHGLNPIVFSNTNFIFYGGTATIDPSGNVAFSGTLHATGASRLDNGAITTDGNGNITAIDTILIVGNSGAGATKLLAIAPPDVSTSQFSLRVSGDTIGIVDDVASIALARLRTAADGSGLKLTNVGSFCTAWSQFTGAATGTYSHGLGTTPNHVTPMQSVVGSQTMGYDTPTSTQVHITSGAGNTFTAEAKRFV